MNPPLIFVTAFLIILASSLQPLTAFAAPFEADIAPEATVVISEIYANSALTPERGDTPEHEFIELHNQSDIPQPIAGVALARDDDLETNETNGEMYLEGDELAPGEYRVINASFALPNGGTTMELYYPGTDGLVLMQQVTYLEVEEAHSLQLFDNEWHSVAPPTPGQPTKPIADETVDEPDSTPPKEEAGGEEVIVDEPPSVEQPENKEMEPPCATSDIIISEIIANPSGSDDDGGEFIELYNQGGTQISLQGCTLSTDKLDAYQFEADATIAPDSYMALPLYNDLLNDGGSVLFAAADYEVAITYPELGDDEAYALIDDVWQLTAKQTPGEKNALPTPIEAATRSLGALLPCPAGKFRNPQTNRCKTIADDSGLKPCAPDQFRNPLTNRCKKKAATSNGLKACSEGQSRNPATNRCRTIALANASLKPCAADQFRNPATNRCKKKDSASGLKPCKDGYERNSETNRCRKESSVNGGASLLEDSGTGSGGTAATGHNIALVVIAASFLAFFLLYEYRLSIRSWLIKTLPAPTSS